MSDVGVVAIIRLRATEPAPELCDALVAGGVGRLEVTLPTPGALAVIASWSPRSDVLVGAGTVRTAEDARAAVAAGARFLVTPTIDAAVLELATRAGVPVYAGASTPTEIETAARLGAAAVKVFPAEQLGGASFVRAVREPLDDVPLLPTGGVSASNAAEYARVGAVGVGVGSSIVAEPLVREADWDAVTARARAVVSAWQHGVGERG